MDWIHRIKQYNALININLEHNKDGSFRFMSTYDTWVYGKFLTPEHASSSEVIVLFHGLGAHMETEGYLEIAQSWINLGYNVIGMDVRHQGGKTLGFPKRDPEGLYLSGIDHLDTYYYYQVYLDAYRLIDVAKLLMPDAHLYATGGSQGGALAIFVGMYHPNVEIIMADMPSCIDIPYLIHNTESGFKTFKNYIAKSNPNSEMIKHLLSEIDLGIICKDIKKPILLSSGDQDNICPLKTTESFFNSIQCDKDLIVYPGYGHGGYDHLHFKKKRQWIEHFRFQNQPIS